MNSPNPDLKSALKTIADQQEQLLRQEKLASLGLLIAGVAHEIKNPLNFIANFAELSKDLSNELQAQVSAMATPLSAELQSTIDTLRENLRKIREQCQRADEIMQAMLNHSKGKEGEFRRVDLNRTLDDYVHLAYQAARITTPGFHANVEKVYDESLDAVEMVPHEMGRVFINLVNNACEAMCEKKRALGREHTPQLTVMTHNHPSHVEIIFRDNGIGIQKGLRDEIFKPFFTTKSANKGSGLGLAICYDIVVREHGGEITFDSEEEMFTEFRIKLPKERAAKP